jgi:DNA-binding NarL/FixJ family response regulator
MFCGTVLVVDDDAATLELLREILESAGYATLCAATGEDALLEARSQRPSLALVDVQLPGLSGLDVCSTLRAEYGQHLPIMLVSGERLEPKERAEGLRHGADDYVLKPFHPEELLARVHRLLVRTWPGRQELDERGGATPLTRREREVLSLLAEGRSQETISTALSISSKTTATHIQRILSKLDVHSRAAAVARAYRLGLVDRHDDDHRPARQGNTAGVGR